MTSVVSLHADPARAAEAAELVRRLSHRLELEPRAGADGSWEFCFSGPYARAHAHLVETLTRVDPDWPARLTLDYALAI